MAFFDAQLARSRNSEVRGGGARQQAYLAALRQRGHDVYWYGQ